MSYYRRIVIICFATLIACLNYNQAMSQQDIESTLKTKMNTVREQRPDSTSDTKIAEIYGVDLIPYLEKYQKDISERVRWQTYNLLWLVGINSDSLIDRQKIVDMLVEGLEDKEGVVSPGWLLDFKAEDFSTVSKELLHKLLDDEERCGWVILLCGVADMKAEIPRLETFLIDETKYPSEYRYKTQSWAARKARARMGVIEDIQRCIELVESELDLQIRLTYLKDLQYIRQPQIVDILHRYLNSNEEVPPMEEWGVKRLKGVGFAQYAAVSLAEILRGFPIKKHLGGYSKDDIERCRQWMSEQKGYEIIR